MQRLVLFSQLLVVVLMLMLEPVQASPAWATQTLIRVSKACADSHVYCRITVQQDRNPLGIDVQQIKSFARSRCSNYAISYVYQKPSQCGDWLVSLTKSLKKYNSDEPLWLLMPSQIFRGMKKIWSLLIFVLQTECVSSQKRYAHCFVEIKLHCAVCIMWIQVSDFPRLAEKKKRNIELQREHSSLFNCFNVVVQSPKCSIIL